MAIYAKRPRTRSERPLHIGLWVTQFLALAAFAIAAWMKIMFPIAKLASIWPWAGVLTPFEVRGLGLIDLLGGLGLVVPMLTRILPRLTVAAAIGCALLQLCAMIFHISRGEANVTPVNLLLLAMVTFIAWGRGWSRSKI